MGAEVAAAGRSSVLQRWPSALGLAVAVVVLATGASRETAAITVTVAAVCYLGAAALGRPWVAWVAIPVGSLVIVVAEVAGVPWWVGLGAVAVVLLAIGLLTGAARSALTAQAVAFAGFGGLAVVAAVLLGPQVGMVLAGFVLAAHGAWDFVHFRRRQVVSRSLAEACMLLDVPLGLGIVVLALLG
jgi:hypothetical protein